MNYQLSKPIVEEKKYALVKDMVENRENIQNSIWFRTLIKDLETKGLAKHKRLIMRSREDVEQFLNTYVLGMINSLMNEGYDLSSNGEVGTALIARMDPFISQLRVTIVSIVPER